MSMNPISPEQQLEWIWANCKIVYWPSDGRHPIEHAPHPRKFSRDLIEAEMSLKKADPEFHSP